MFWLLLNHIMHDWCAGIVENQVGCSVTVGIESSAQHKLQTMPLMSISHTQDGKRYVLGIFHGFLCMHGGVSVCSLCCPLACRPSLR